MFPFLALAAVGLYLIAGSSSTNTTAAAAAATAAARSAQIVAANLMQYFGGTTVSSELYSAPAGAATWGDGTPAAYWLVVVGGVHPRSAHGSNAPLMQLGSIDADASGRPMSVLQVVYGGGGARQNIWQYSSPTSGNHYLVASPTQPPGASLLIGSNEPWPAGVPTA